MTLLFYFDAPVTGLTANSSVVADFRAEASNSSPTDASLFSFEQRGSNVMVVHYDDDGNSTVASQQALVTAVENVYGVTHRRTEVV